MKALYYLLVCLAWTTGILFSALLLVVAVHLTVVSLAGAFLFALLGGALPGLIRDGVSWLRKD